MTDNLITAVFFGIPAIALIFFTVMLIHEDFKKGDHHNEMD